MKGRVRVFLAALLLIGVGALIWGPPISRSQTRYPNDEPTPTAPTTPLTITTSRFWPIGGSSATSGGSLTPALVTTDGYISVLDRQADNWQTTGLILNANPVNHKFVSPVLDLRQFGGNKMIGIKAAGSVNLYVSAYGMVTATADSNSRFTFELGRSRPGGVGGTQGRGVFRTISFATAALDSTLTAANTNRSFAFKDSVTGDEFDWPYGQIVVWSDSAATAISGVYLTISGRPHR